MNFHIDIVSQEVLAGWVTPDNPSVCPRFVVEIPDRDPIEFEANVFRGDLLELGWHATGQVGFYVDQKLVPDIAALTDIALVDFYTGLTLYRRTTPVEHLEGKLMLFDCSLMPQWRLHSMIGQHFGVRYTSIDRQALETNLAILWNPHNKSVFASGMPNYHRYMAPLEERDFKCVVLLRPPLDELAERLLFLNALAKMPVSSTVRQMFGQLEGLIGKVAETDLSSKKSLVSLLRGLDGRDKDVMRSPVTRTFGAEVTDGLDRKKVAVALDNLAKMDLVGRRSDYEVFSAVLDGLLERKVLAGSSLSTIPGTAELAQHLRNIGPATDMVEEDLALYEFAEDSLLEMEKVRS